MAEDKCRPPRPWWYRQGMNKHVWTALGNRRAQHQHKNTVASTTGTRPWWYRQGLNRHVQTALGNRPAQHQHKTQSPAQQANTHSKQTSRITKQHLTVCHPACHDSTQCASLHPNTAVIHVPACLCYTLATPNPDQQTAAPTPRPASKQGASRPSQACLCIDTY